MKNDFTIYKNKKDDHQYLICVISYDQNIIEKLKYKKIYLEPFLVGDDETIFSLLFEQKEGEINFDICIFYSENYSYNIIKFIPEIKLITDIPILVISGSYDELFVVDLLRIGADDCVVSAIGTIDINLRIEKLIEKNRNIADQKNHNVQNNSIDNNDNNNKIFVFEKFYKYFTPSEGKILRELIENKGKVVSRKSLSLHTRDSYKNTSKRTVDNIICRIRKKLDMLSINNYVIKTYSSLGYSFIGDPDKFFYDLSINIEKYEKTLPENRN
jgi:two-component system response regulator BaeR